MRPRPPTTLCAISVDSLTPAAPGTLTAAPRRRDVPNPPRASRCRRRPSTAPVHPERAARHQASASSTEDEPEGRSRSIPQVLEPSAAAATISRSGPRRRAHGVLRDLIRRAPDARSMRGPGARGAQDRVGRRRRAHGTRCCVSSGPRALPGDLSPRRTRSPPCSARRRCPCAAPRSAMPAATVPTAPPPTTAARQVPSPRRPSPSGQLRSASSLPPTCCEVSARAAHASVACFSRRYADPNDGCRLLLSAMVPLLRGRQDDV